MEEVVVNLRQARTVLQEAQDMIRGSSYSLQFVQDRIDEVTDTCRISHVLRAAPLQLIVEAPAESRVAPRGLPGSLDYCPFPSHPAGKMRLHQCVQEAGVLVTSLISS